MGVHGSHFEEQEAKDQGMMNMSFIGHMVSFVTAKLWQYVRKEPADSMLRERT